MAIVVAGGEISPIEWQALKVAGKEADNLRAEVEVGSNQEIYFGLQVAGKIDVADGKLQITTSKPRPELLLATILDRLDRGGLQDGAALTAYFARRKGDLEPSEQSIAVAKTIIDRLSTRESKPAHGAVKGSLTLTRL